MRRIFIVSLLLLLTLLPTYGLNNGYMGRRFIFQVDGSFTPPDLWFWSLATEKPVQSFVKAPYFNVSPKLECIVWRKGTVSVNYTYFQGDVTYRSLQSENGHFMDDYGVNYHSNAIGVGYKQYFSPRAPMGGFIELTYTNYLINYQVNESYVAQALVAGYEVKSSGYDGGVRLRFGYDWLFWSRMRVSVGVSLESMFKCWQGIQDFTESVVPPLYGASYGLWRNSLFGIDVGIGILAF